MIIFNKIKYKYGPCQLAGKQKLFLPKHWEVFTENCYSGQYSMLSVIWMPQSSILFCETATFKTIYELPREAATFECRDDATGTGPTLTVHNNVYGKKALCQY